MNDTQADFGERLERYLAGDMADGERRAFETEILDNPNLAAALYTDVQLQTAVAKAAEANRGRRILPEDARAPGEQQGHVGHGGRHEHVARAGRRWWQLPSLRWAVPAVAALAIVSWVVFVPRGPSDDVFRGADRQFEALMPVDDIDAVPARFVWTRHPDAAQYRFSLFDADSRLLHSLVAADTVAVVDTADVPVPLHGYWTVTPLAETMTGIGSDVLAWYRVRR